MTSDGARTLRPELRDAFARELGRRLGLRFTPDRQVILDRGAARAADALREPEEVLLRRVERGDPDALSALAAQVTTPETYFFRHAHHFERLRDALPALLRALRPGEPLRCWSAGCSTGEEAYSMAITAFEVLGPAAGEVVEILATDVNPLALDRAREATYGPWSFREVPEDVRARWFEPVAGGLRVAPGPRALVRVAPFNLIEAIPSAWPWGIHVIFCRNVLMYLDPPAITSAGASLARALAPAGFLLLGPSDPLLHTPLLALEVTRTLVVYRPAAARPATAAPPRRAAPAPPPRRAILAAPPAAGPIPATPEEAPLERARRLADAGEAAAALALLDVEAARDPPRPEAYALRGVVRQALGDHAGAADDAGRAILIDRGFAFAHLLAATSRGRLGDHERAHAHLRRASSLLGALDPGAAAPGAGGATAAALLAACGRLARALGAPRRADEPAGRMQR